MSLTTPFIRVYTNGAWQDIKKVYHNGSWKPIRGVYHNGNWIELQNTTNTTISPSTAEYGYIECTGADTVTDSRTTSGTGTMAKSVETNNSTLTFGCRFNSNGYACRRIYMAFDVSGITTAVGAKIRAESGDSYFYNVEILEGGQGDTLETADFDYYYNQAIYYYTYGVDTSTFENGYYNNYFNSTGVNAINNNNTLYVGINSNQDLDDESGSTTLLEDYGTFKLEIEYGV